MLVGHEVLALRIDRQRMNFGFVSSNVHLIEMDEFKKGVVCVLGLFSLLFSVVVESHWVRPCF